MKKLKNIDYIILFELVKNSKISDRKLAKVIGVSQPTVTRRRALLEKEGLLDYTAIPDFEKLGFEIVAFTFIDLRHDTHNSVNAEEAKGFLSSRSNIVFASTGRGLQRDMVCVSIHKNYSDYAKLREEFNKDWGDYMTQFDSFIISIGSDNILKQFSFKHLEKCMEDT
ncbi:MAG: winged helix-turn-helix transcriptional regulator [Candidatus Bathyarchaeota archaeon]|nr:winged helix-turn-helix transcriptional regulator [Candidatus Bathyarchaeota archaeon]